MDLEYFFGHDLKKKKKKQRISEKLKFMETLVELIIFIYL